MRGIWDRDYRNELDQSDLPPKKLGYAEDDGPLGNLSKTNVSRLISAPQTALSAAYSFLTDTKQH